VGVELDPEPGLSLTEMVQAAGEGRLQALYVVGENPLMSEPDLGHARPAFSRIGFLAVQDLFLTETALMADVVLPAACFAEKDGTFTQHGAPHPAGAHARAPAAGRGARGLAHCSEIATARLPMTYTSSAAIMDEIASLAPIYGACPPRAPREKRRPPVALLER